MCYFRGDSPSEVWGGVDVGSVQPSLMQEAALLTLGTGGRSLEDILEELFYRQVTLMLVCLEVTRSLDILFSRVI